MSIHSRRRSWFAAAVVTAGVAAAATFTVGNASAGTVQAAPPVRHMCQAPAGGGISCLGLIRTDIKPVASLAANIDPSGLSPADLISAYNLPDGGEGVTVAIIDALDNPKAEADLAVYRKQFNLPPCTTANGCFTKLDQKGGTNYPKEDSGWAGEISLDLDMVSAVCPKCKIMLLEGDETTDFKAVGEAINTAVAKGAKFISNSYGDKEAATDPETTKAYYDHPGVVQTVSSGDDGYGASYPASAPTVVAIGGTALRKGGGTRGWTETAWTGAGSGCSANGVKPTWQKDPSCAKRTVADIAAVADPATGVATYDSYGGGWGVAGGTSASAPIVAAAWALAGAPKDGDNPASYPYAHAGSLFDVTSGSNGSCTPSGYLCKAVAGYDGPTGLGTLNGVAALKAPAA